jgi:hypothetical protein
VNCPTIHQNWHSRVELTFVGNQGTAGAGIFLRRSVLSALAKRPMRVIIAAAVFAFGKLAGAAIAG